MQPMNNHSNHTSESAGQPAQLPFCPYIGLRPFGEVDSQRFYGRDSDARTVLSHLHRHPLVAIIGASGIGKTSLVNAGVVPAVRDEPETWVVRTMRPGNTPVQRLLHVFGGRRAAGSPSKMVASVLEPDGGRLLLVVDQFEDIFALANESERATFQKALLRFATVSNCHILLNVRADFYDDVLSASIWPSVRRHTVTVGPLKREQLREAIVQPAADVNVQFEPAFVDRLLRDAAGERDALPWLQETLVLLWQHLEGRYLSLSAYEQLVQKGAGQADLSSHTLASLQVGLARNADDAFESLTQRQQTLARHTFLRLLSLDAFEPAVLIEEKVADLRANLGESTQLEQMLQRLAQARILTLNQEASTVAFTHDALIRGWPRLRAWMAEWKSALRTSDYLADRALAWSDADGSAQEMLLDEAALPEAERWLTSPVAAEVGYSDAVPAFIEASRDAVETARRQHAQASQQDLQDARATLQQRTADLTEERSQNEELRRERRIFRLLSLGLGVFFILALIGGIVAGTDRQHALDAQATAQAEADGRATVVVGLQSTVEAQQEAGATNAGRIDHANALAAHAVTQVRAGNTDLALLLAREAISTTYHVGGSVLPVADAAVREALTAAGWQAGFSAHDAPINAIAFMPDGQQLVTAGEDGTARMWTTSDGVEQATLIGHTGPVLDVATANDGQRIATAGQDGTIRLWDAGTTDQIVILETHTGPVRSVAFSVDSRRLVSASDDGSVRVWDAGNGQQLQQFSFPDGATTAQFDPDGTRIVAGGQDGTARVWNAASGEQLFVTAPHAGAVRTAGFSPDGSLLATADGSACNRSCFVYVWDAAGGTLRRTLPADAAMTDIHLTADGTELLAMDRNGGIYLWNLSTGERRIELHGASSGPAPATIRSDGRWAAVAGMDGTVRLVPLTPDVLMELAREQVERRPAVLTCEERAQFVDEDEACITSEPAS